MKSLIEKRARQAQYLQSLFPSLNDMKGIIVKIEPEEGFEAYKKKIGDPMKEDTLIIGDDDCNIMLFFKCENRIHVNKICKGVTVIDCFTYDKTIIIHKQVAPAELPKRLEKYVFDFVPVELIHKMENVNLQDPLQHFLTKYYIPGGMTKLGDMKQLPEWRNEWRDCLEIKQTQMCKSCGEKAKRGCCEYYATTNRKPLLMVYGWTKK